MRSLGSEPMKGKVITILFAAYMACVLRITVFRWGISIQNLFSGTVNANLFAAYIPLLKQKDWFRIVYLFGGNIIWFIPFGMYLRRKGKRSFTRIAVTGFLFSLFIETMQYILGTGISELDDLVLNTFGALAGAGISSLLPSGRKTFLRK